MYTFYDAVIMFSLLCSLHPSTYVSFSVENASLSSFEDVRQLILERGNTLTELNFQILELSQGKFYILFCIKIFYFA